MNLDDIRAGDIYRVGRAAGVQFGFRPILFAVTRVRTDLSTYPDWINLDGYELDEQLLAVERRQIFVQYAGLEFVTARRTSQRERIVRAAQRRNDQPAAAARIPRPRTSPESTIRRKR